MTLGPAGCGVEEHPESCLCDVVITNPTPVSARIPFDYEYGSAIAQYGKWDGTLVHWFEIYDTARKALLAYRANGQRYNFERRMPDEAYEFLVQGIRDGVSNTPLKNALYDKYQVTIDRSYVTHLRKRLTRKGLL